MFSLNEYISYYLYPRYIDMNKGIECLSELIRSQMNANPLSGDAFLFFGKKKDMVKVLRWDTDGFILYQKRLEEGTFELLPKKEVANLLNEMEKLQKNIGGIKEMTKIPDVMFVVDPRKEKIAIQEAHILGIPVVANCDPEEVDYVIPGNDDAIRAVKLIAGKIADAVIEAKQGEQEVTSTEEAADAE